ncbi:MFS transporter [Thiohalophilus sp.]|uniref:MFS transporter n=1 Tax=Thiohalophilus sp. TaxID=3028392 RepID=UPI002ACD464E|nr:MFS transporter [Thiohalophilus sp.]MDZ7663276.1 MFS transporter [Thiohalophilus sp.]
MSSKAPYWRLSAFYLFYFASLGALVPYWGLYLKSLGYEAAAIGTIMGVVMATKIVSPNIWGWIADHTGKRMAIVQLGSLLALLTFTGVYLSSDFWWLVLVMAVFSFFWNAALPQFEATTFNHLVGQVHRYSSIRLWGSVGFILSVWAIGSTLEGEAIRWLPHVLLFLFAAIWLSSIVVPEEAAGHMPLDHPPLRQVLAKPAVAGLLIACFLMQASHGPYYTFYSIYMEEAGYSLDKIGLLWALGVLAEVAVFLVMHRLVPRFGLRGLLMLSLLLATLRWVLIGLFPHWVLIMVFAQLLHAASFGIYHAAAIQMIHLFFSGRHQGKGQALYSSLSFGAGGAVGSFYSGYLYDLSGPLVMYSLAAALSLIGMLVVYVFVYPPTDESVAVK